MVEFGQQKGGETMKPAFFTYIIESGAELKIHTPGIEDFSQINTQTVQRADCIFMQSDYPIGWHIEAEQYTDRIVLYSNKPLVQNADGSFNAPTE